MGKNGLAYILNSKGAVVAFPDPSKLKQPKDDESGAMRLTTIDELDDLLSRKAFGSVALPRDGSDIRQALFGSFRYQQQRYHTMLKPFDDPQWPWLIGIYLPEDDYLGPIKRNRLLNIYIMLGIAIIGSIVGWRIVRSIVRPMTALQLEAQAIQRDDLDTVFDKHSFIKEIQDTADSFIQMKAGLKSMRYHNHKLTEGLRERAETLQRQELYLRATLTSLVNFSDALVVLDQRHKVRFMNPAAEALLGIQAETSMGQSLPFPVAKQHATEVAIDTHSGQTLIAEMRVVETEWEGQAALLVALRDITTQKQLELEQKQLLEETKQLYKQAEQDAHTKTVLLQEVNHRVKNNLSAIIGVLYAERRHSWAREEPGFQATLADLIVRIQGLATVHDLLSETEWQPVRLHELTESVVHAALQALPFDQEVSVAVSPVSIRVPPIQVNGLAMIINEMASNTMKYGLHPERHGLIRVDITVADDGRTVDFQYRDNGPGYPDDVLAQQRFNTGLYLIQRLATRDLRGSFSLYNEQGAVAVLRFMITTDAKENDDV